MNLLYTLPIWAIILIVFGSIIIFGGISGFLYIKFLIKKKVQKKPSETLKQEKKVRIKEKDIISFLGDNENILSVSSTSSKITFVVKDIKKVNLEKLKNLNEIEGVIKTNNKISLIIPQKAITLKTKLGY